MQEARNLVGSVVTASIESGGDYDTVMKAAEDIKEDFQDILDHQ